MTDPSTLGIAFSQSTFLAEPLFDLVVNGQVFPLDRTFVSLGSLTRIPCNDVALEGLADLQASLMLSEGKLMFRNVHSQSQILKDGQPFSMGELQDGDALQIGAYSVQVRTHQPGAASFELYTDPWRGRRYHLSAHQDVLIGRPGKRSNHIFLDDVTVSRAHARMTWQDGKLWLHAETDVSPTCLNGKVVEGRQPVHSGDLVQFGKQIGRLRYTLVSAPAADLAAQTCTLLHVDVNNYSALLDKGADDQLVRQLSQLYEIVAEAVEQSGGRLCAYQGEALTAVYGMEDHSKQSVLQAQQAALQITAKVQGGELAVSCGIFTGPVVLGQTGYQHGQELTPVGAGAHEAARLQAQAHERGLGLLLCGRSSEMLS